MSYTDWVCGEERLFGSGVVSDVDLRAAAVVGEVDTRSGF